jgi:T5SS/PEP-CTERM-associated repeat protein
MVKMNPTYLFQKLRAAGCLEYSTRVRRLIRRSLGAGVFILLHSSLNPSATAQYDYSLNYQTNTINVSSNWVDSASSRYVVGSNTFLNALIINSGGVLSNGFGYLGFETGGSNNVAIVNGGVWSNRSELYVGYAGAGNRMVVSNQGKFVMFGGSTDIGWAQSSSNNSVLLSGVGSSWDNILGEIAVGVAGEGNQLTVANGGTLNVNYVSSGGTASSSNNVITVTDNNSWVQMSYLHIGINGSQNALIVSNGAALDTALVGILGVFESSRSNSATVTGLGSRWWSQGSILIGHLGGENTLLVTNQGSVLSDIGTIGNKSGTNRVTIIGTGSAWTNITTLSVGATNQQANSISVLAGGTLVSGALKVHSNNSVNVDSGRLIVNGVVTNFGTISMQNSVGTFNGAVVNSGAWITDPTTNFFQNVFSVTPSGYISATVGDVFIFTNGPSTAANFINTSSQSNSYQTANAKFVFNSTLSLTQNFWTAGKNLGPASLLHTQQITAAQFAALGTNNFSLGTLEIGANNILGIWDTYSDGNALYVSNLVLGASANLVIGSNTWVYYVNLSNLSGGQITFASYDLPLVISAVPEPNVAVLWIAGAATAIGARRRHRRMTRAQTQALAEQPPHPLGTPTAVLGDLSPPISVTIAPKIRRVRRKQAWHQARRSHRPDLITQTEKTIRAIRQRFWV